MIQYFRDLKTSRKLAMGFGLGIASTLIVGLLAMSRTAQLTEDIRATYVGQRAMGNAGNLNIDILRYREAQQDLIIETSAAEMAAQRALLTRWSGQFEKDLAALKETVYTEKGRDTVRTVEDQWASFAPIRRRIEDLAYSNHNIEAQALSKSEGARAEGSLVQTLSDFVA